MIIVPNNSAKKTYKHHTTTQQVVTLQSFLDEQLALTTWEVASPSIIDYILSETISDHHLDTAKQHIRYIYQNDLSLSYLSQHTHPNAQWISTIVQHLEDRLATYQLIHPDAVAKKLLQTASPSGSIQHFGFLHLPPNISQLFQHYKMTPLAQDHYPLPNPQHSVAYFSQIHDEASAALHWLTSTPNRAIIKLNADYDETLARLMLTHTGCIPSPFKQNPLVQFMTSVSAPTPCIPYEVVTYISQMNIYPDGFIPTRLMNKRHFQDNHYQLPFSYLSMLEHQSTLAISASHFIQLIRDTLQIWHLNRFPSAIKKHLDNTLDDLNTLAFIDVMQPYTQWHSLFTKKLQQGHQPFDLNILSPTEAIGTQFDAIWILGSEQSSWSQRAKLFALPQESITTLDWHILSKMAKTTVFSLQKISATGDKQHVPDTFSPSPFSLETPSNTVQTSLIDDWHLTESSKPTGGVSLIQDYQSCAFKAFAKHRLNIRKKTPITLDVAPHHYGTITHSVLEDLYQDIRSQEDLQHITSPQIHALIEGAWQRHSASDNLHPNLVNILKTRMLETILAWVDTDLSRDHFTIKALESEIPLNLGEFTVAIRIDRIDTANHQPVLIDYKTGRANITDTFLPSFEFPQMALYSLTQNQAPAIAYAKLLPQTINWQPVDLSCQQSLDKQLTARGQDKMSLAQLQTLWRTLAEKSLTLYAQGTFPAKPASPKVCDQCDFMSFCRLYAQGENS